ncbi:MAG: UbiA family prenyltransferase, partial [Methanobacteriota archaeon]
MKAGALLDFVKIEHSLFSLPFVFAGMAFAYEPSGTLARPVEVVFLLAVVAAISARTLAMTLNRLIDKEIDLRNPRTADRALPAGELSQRTAWAIAAASALGLVAAAGLLNRLCLLLSPLLVAAFVVYPFLKRWTAACHFGLGAAWAPAPMGGYLAMTGSFDGSLPVLLLSAAALFWLAGFDILYAL